MKTLDQIPKGEFVEVVEVVAGMDAPGAGHDPESDPQDDPITRRLSDLGVRKGVQIEVIRRAPLGDPTVYELCSYQLCLRRTESVRVRVRSIARPLDPPSDLPPDVGRPPSEYERG